MKNCMNYDSLPEVIREQCGFCCWRRENRNGRGTKVPYTPTSGNYARSNDVKTFRPFDVALTAYNNSQESNKPYDGLGICVDGNIGAIDIDHCIEGDKLNDVATAVLGAFNDCYFEVSPSGTGLRGFFQVSPDFQYDTAHYYMKNSTYGLEIYLPGHTSRFVTVTGDVYQDGPVSTDMDALQIILDTFMLRDTPPDDGAATSPDISTPHSYLTDEEVIEKASKSSNGALFADLYNGLWQEHSDKYPSQSEADMAFASMLAFWCGCDFEQMDRIFETSGLYREKWERQQSGSTYGAITLESAIKKCKSVYSPRSSAADDFDTLDDSSPSDVTALSLEPSDYTDVGQAQLFFRHYGDRVRFSTATKWLVFTGKKWDESVLKAHGLAQELTDKQLVEARKRLKKARVSADKAIEAGDESKKKTAQNEEDRAKAFQAFVIGRRKTSRISATLAEAEPAAEINVKKLDADPFLMNTPGGTVDLRTGEIRPHDPNDFITKMTLVSPSEDGMDLWLGFLDRMTCGDKELQEYHQLIAGLQAVGKVFVENLIIATGVGGNGKSTFYNAQAKVLGDYASSISSDVLIANSRKNKSPEYAELRGKRLVIAAELEEGMRLDTGVVKRLCSVDPIRAEKKFKDPFDFIPSHTTILYTNHLPKVGTNDKGTWDRLVVVPFNANFRGQQGEIFNYGDHLVEHAGGAILAWIIEGAQKLIAANFHIEQPECVKEAVQDYRAQNDWFHNFINDRCEIGGSYTVGSQALYLNYRNYCDEIGDFKRSSAEFKNEMLKNCYKWHKSKGGAKYYGIRLSSDFTEYSDVLPAFSA